VADKEREIHARLLAVFKTDAEEQIRTIASGLGELAHGLCGERQAEVIEAIFREAHNLKGAAMIVRQPEIENVCQMLETLFAAWKQKEREPAPAMFELALRAIDGVSRHLEAMSSGHIEAGRQPLAGIIAHIERQLLVDANPPATTASVRTDPPQAARRATQPLARKKRGRLAEQTVRVSTAQLDSLMQQAEELIVAKLAASQRLSELQEMSAHLAAWEREWAKRRLALAALKQSYDAMSAHDRAGIDEHLDSLLEYVDRNKESVETLAASVAEATRLAERDRRVLMGTVDNLLRALNQVLMVPFSVLLELLPRLVRDLAGSQGKEVDLVIHGAEFQVDRRILQEIKDPLIHLVRNCIDHGIERTEERLSAGKPARGKIAITIMPKEGSQVEILVADDGAGIDLEQVRAVAVKQNLVSQAAAEKLSKHDISAYVFRSGLSTSSAVTGVSGRGLGMAIVQEKVENLGGVVSLDTQPGIGTTFRIILPLTLSAMRGILVRVGKHRFVFPTSEVSRVARLGGAEIQNMETWGAARINGQLTTVAPLAQILGLPAIWSGDKATAMPVVVVNSARQHLAFLVDEVLGEQEVLMKGLGPQLMRVRNIAGATVLSTGEVVPILNVPDLTKAVLNAEAIFHRASDAARTAAEKQKSILVVEDSITARTQLKSILELAGYSVKTAVDGEDALGVLQKESFDLVMSDVDMPRMNGLDLTAKIRTEERWADLPVVLVTALDSIQDRQRGIAVGANAYVVKKNFDQGNLLDVIRRLI
jgi:two-component system chemotaxis sensor kinase CheA